MIAKELIEYLKLNPNDEVEIITVKANDLAVRGVYKSIDGKIKITNYEFKRSKDEV